MFDEYDQTEYYKEDFVPLAEYCWHCDESYQPGTGNCEKCGGKLEEV